MRTKQGLLVIVSVVYVVILPQFVVSNFVSIIGPHYVLQTAPINVITDSVRHKRATQLIPGSAFQLVMLILLRPPRRLLKVSLLKLERTMISAI